MQYVNFMLALSAITFKLSNYAFNLLCVEYCLDTQNMRHFAIFVQLLKELDCYFFLCTAKPTKHYQKSFQVFRIKLCYGDSS